MRRLIGTAALALALCGCKQAEQTQPALRELSVADPRAEAQLLTGFHNVENNTWRWTKGRFSVLLQSPKDAARQGARLELHFSAPEPVLTRRQSITLSASVEGTPLPPETYAKAGAQVYTREVPASAFTGKTVRVEFALDRYLAAGEIESRELGVIAEKAALLPR